MSNSQQNKEDEFCKKLFFNKYRPVKKLGEGSFGKIYWNLKHIYYAILKDVK